MTVNTDLSSLLGNGKASGDGKLLDVLRTIQQHLNEGTAGIAQGSSSAPT